MQNSDWFTSLVSAALRKHIYIHIHKHATLKAPQPVALCPCTLLSFPRSERDVRVQSSVDVGPLIKNMGKNKAFIINRRSYQSSHVINDKLPNCRSNNVTPFSVNIIIYYERHGDVAVIISPFFKCASLFWLIDFNAFIRRVNIIRNIMLSGINRRCYAVPWGRFCLFHFQFYYFNTVLIHMADVFNKESFECAFE